MSAYDIPPPIAKRGEIVMADNPRKRPIVAERAIVLSLYYMIDEFGAGWRYNVLFERKSANGHHIEAKVSGARVAKVPS